MSTDIPPVFTCKLCGTKHEATEKGATNGVWKLPASVTTEWHKNGWILRCTGECP